MDEEDVCRPVLGRRPDRIGGEQRPARPARIIWRRRRTVGLERLAGVQRGPEQLVAEDESGRQRQRQHRPTGEPEAGLERRARMAGGGGVGHGTVRV